MNRISISLFFSTVLFLGAINAQEYRSINGLGNNAQVPEWGAAGGPVIFEVPPAFADGISAPVRSNLVNPRRVSNALFHQEHSHDDFMGLSDFAWAFGQFVDHDITLIELYNIMSSPHENFSIRVPDEDTIMTPGKIIPLMRSLARSGTGTDVNNPRAYSNEITAFLDASAVYGSDEDRASWLRTFNGGKLKTSKGNLLPWNTVDGEFGSAIDRNAPHMADDVGLSAKLFVAGDVRANENPMLLSFHLLFVREHNRLCEQFLLEDPSLDPNNPRTDEELYQRARRVVSGILQHIVYEEWLPTLGVRTSAYTGYQEQVNPSISNLFSAAGFRWGHTMINETILRNNKDGEVIQAGHISLKDAFFNPLESLRHSPEVYFKGMGAQVQQHLDCKLVSSVRNFLFQGNPILGGLDLAAINIQRGRERGLPDYNTLREYFGMGRVGSFDEICSDQEVNQILEQVYHDVDSIDPWVAFLAEDPIENSIFGPMLERNMREQFEALRDGDRFYYLNDPHLVEDDMELIMSTTMSELVMRNTDLICFQDNAFQATEHEDIACFPEVIPTDLRAHLAPNPVVHETYLSLYSVKEAPAVIRLVNESGQDLMTLNRQLQPGVNEILLTLNPQLPSGPYYLIIEREEDLVSLKILKI